LHACDGHQSANNAEVSPADAAPSALLRMSRS
jgi:hypothetical protein